MRYDKDQLKEKLTIEDIKKIIAEFDETEPIENDDVIFKTVCHGGDSHKLYYYSDSQLFRCYTGCSETFDIYELIIRAKKAQGYTYSFSQAVRFVAEVTNKTFGFGMRSKQEDENQIDDWQWINKFKKKKKNNATLKICDERVLDVFLPYPHISWIEEGISYETLKKFEVGYYFREEKISIVHRDIDGNLIGLRGRATLQEDIDNGRKYMPLTIENKTYRHATALNLFGLNHTKDAIKRLKKVAIFEGEKSVFKVEDYYKENNFSVAVCSNTISDVHKDIILSLGVEEVFICFDKFRDKKELESEELYEQRLTEYKERILKLAHKFSPYVRVYILYDTKGLLNGGDSPVDQGKETLEKLMKEKFEIKTSEVN